MKNTPQNKVIFGKVYRNIVLPVLLAAQLSSCVDAGCDVAPGAVTMKMTEERARDLCNSINSGQQFEFDGEKFQVYWDQSIGCSHMFLTQRTELGEQLWKVKIQVTNGAVYVEHISGEKSDYTEEKVVKICQNIAAIVVD